MERADQESVLKKQQGEGQRQDSTGGEHLEAAVVLVNQNLSARAPERGQTRFLTHM